VEALMETKVPTVSLVDGRSMPVLGLGVWESGRGEPTYRAVRDALELGYRHIDTAKIYGNERDVGRALRESGIPREELFVTTKLWNSDQGFESAKRACEASLAALGLDYLDLYLVHFPAPKRLESYRALVELQAAGKCRSIGVSNFTARHLEELVRELGVVPAVNQIELHPFLQQRSIVEACVAKKIVVEAYSPLARGQRMSHPVIVRIAKALGRTPAQVHLRWGVQHGYVVIPKSVHRARIDENARLFDFEIPAPEMAALDALDEGFRTCWDPTDAP
jgi:diketogulonate reductase-like aldo/keto reductase